jgi:Glycosyl hydrolases family 2, sugar binding domain
VGRIGRSWTRIQVPGHWQCVAAFAAYEGLMLYRCRFGYRLLLGDSMIALRFGGVYYSARVWLNGVLLGEHKGYFAPFGFDVTGILADGENELLVEVYSPGEAEENALVTIGGVWARWDGLGPNLNPGGIFKDVALISGGEVRIRALGSTADHTGRGQAHVELYARRGLWTKLVGTIRPLGFEAPGTEFEKEVRSNRDTIASSSIFACRRSESGGRGTGGSSRCTRWC